MFFDFTKPSIYCSLQEGPTVCPPQVDFYVRLIVSAVEDPKITHHGE